MTIALARRDLLILVSVALCVVVLSTAQVTTTDSGRNVSIVGPVLLEDAGGMADTKDQKKVPNRLLPPHERPEKPRLANAEPPSNKEPAGVMSESVARAPAIGFYEPDGPISDDKAT